LRWGRRALRNDTVAFLLDFALVICTTRGLS
jgi:hypothetical protein